MSGSGCYESPRVPKEFKIDAGQYRVTSFDSEWRQAFYVAVFNGVGELDLSCIKRIIAAYRCERHAGDNLMAIVELSNNGWAYGKKPFLVMRADPGATGWDYSGSGSSEFYDTEEEAVSVKTITSEERKILGL